MEETLGCVILIGQPNAESAAQTKEEFSRDTVQTVDTFSTEFHHTGEADFRCYEQSAVSEGFVIVEGSGVDCVERPKELGNEVR